ncbi:DUF3951 domain-containing protein [Lysinibacillus xylanilyticus]|uniref:DUF3951 domain-containing protein n=1 Tax=Lysinibacillus TaxID=400634 RepID=UPI002B25223E|nr:DUF3951 domain-containing protein [Lysinibacillus xylanilyticus]MEB2298528.1 DUF3951 domain-containing protein [Lysinibacillus xylanilyticus]
MNIGNSVALIVSLVFSSILVRAIYRVFVKKKTPTIIYTPYDDAVDGGGKHDN